jgi:exosome complex component RRP4
MRGHGTYIPPTSTSIVSSLTGTITLTNKLVSVRPVRGRYKPEVGSLLVGRIREVDFGRKRWRVEIGCEGGGGDGWLLLSSINLPGGVQVSLFVIRRRDRLKSKELSRDENKLQMNFR